ncbi:MULTISPECIES: hypothetical protein [Nostoc]|uniref:Uncharacterized protein n=1 Tax=Nostoc paludosum FACHB-159 TaxID=2692908 RepID=A0ABR8KFY4_9NOSO|nr:MULTISPECIES: hypothetical protein [Nostoc]MBD2680691.1 hypothetical protein [Nostoc sp. FACHB-857]MBD2737205.1 hypothetical protein [Nostoc paludosum FACHB-159]
MPHINSSRVTQYQAQRQTVSLFPENPLIFLFIVGTEELVDGGVWGVWEERAKRFLPYPPTHFNAQ